MEAKLTPFGLSSEERIAAEEYARTGKGSAISNEFGRDSVKRIMAAAEVIREHNGKNGVDSRQGEGYNGIEVGKDTQYYKYTQLKTEPNTAYFWSGRSSGIGGKEFSMSHAIQNGGTTLEGLMEAQGIKMPIWDINDPVTVKAWDNASAAFANQASGEVRAIIGSELRPNNVWQSIELIRLKKNSKVTKIITIDPYTLIEDVIYRR